MKPVVLLVVVCSWFVAGCGGEAKDSNGDPPTKPREGGGDTSRCDEGCEAVLAADCEQGPPTQAACEEDCERFATGSCAAEYEALQDCSEGKTLTCSSLGLPTVPGCGAEQTAFLLCGP